MRLTVYGGMSAALASWAVVAAFRQRSNFYSACVYLSKSNACMMILANLGILLTILAGRSLQFLLFGTLRTIEVERMHDRLWFTVTETLLALAMFREEFDAVFVVLFVSLIFVKCFHWLAADRVEWMEQMANPPSAVFHLRMLASLTTLWMTDVLFIVYAAESILLEGPSVILMFAMEYIVLIISCWSTISKYAINVYGIRRAALQANEGRDNHWEEKSSYVFYVDLASDFFKLMTYIGFLSLALTFYGLPINVLRDVYATARSFIIKCNHLARFRRATRNMDERYPSATREEMEALTDKTCIICRDDMEHRDAGAGAVPAAPEGQNPAVPHGGPNETPKKLPCGHVFHFHCLRSWLERQQTCPTCRRTVIAEETRRPTANPAAPGQRQGAPANAGAPLQPQGGAPDAGGQAIRPPGPAPFGHLPVPRRAAAESAREQLRNIPTSQIRGIRGPLRDRPSTNRPREAGPENPLASFVLPTYSGSSSTPRDMHAAAAKASAGGSMAQGTSDEAAKEWQAYANFLAKLTQQKGRSPFGGEVKEQSAPATGDLAKTSRPSTPPPSTSATSPTSDKNGDSEEVEDMVKTPRASLLRPTPLIGSAINPVATSGLHLGHADMPRLIPLFAADGTTLDPRLFPPPSTLPSGRPSTLTNGAGAPLASVPLFGREADGEGGGLSQEQLENLSQVTRRGLEEQLRLLASVQARLAACASQLTGALGVIPPARPARVDAEGAGPAGAATDDAAGPRARAREREATVTPREKGKAPVEGIHAVPPPGGFGGSAEAVERPVAWETPQSGEDGS